MALFEDTAQGAPLTRKAGVLVNYAGAAVSLDMVGGKVVKAGIGLTGVGAQTVDAADAAAALVGTSLDDAAIEQAASLAAEVAKPRSDHRGSASYKKHVVATFVSRILGNVQREELQVA